MREGTNLQAGGGEENDDNNDYGGGGEDNGVHNDGVDDSDFDGVHNDGINNSDFDGVHNDGVDDSDLDGVHNDGVDESDLDGVHNDGVDDSDFDPLETRKQKLDTTATMTPVRSKRTRVSARFKGKTSESSGKTRKKYRPQRKLPTMKQKARNKAKKRLGRDVRKKAQQKIKEKGRRLTPVECAKLLLDTLRKNRKRYEDGIFLGLYWDEKIEDYCHIINNRRINLVDAEHFLCKAYICYIMTTASQYVSVIPDFTKPWCHPTS